MLYVLTTMDEPGIDSNALVSKQGGEDLANSWAQYDMMDCEHRKNLIDDVKRVRLRTLTFVSLPTHLSFQNEPETDR